MFHTHLDVGKQSIAASVLSVFLHGSLQGIHFSMRKSGIGFCTPKGMSGVKECFPISPCILFESTSPLFQPLGCRRVYPYLPMLKHLNSHL